MARLIWLFLLTAHSPVLMSNAPSYFQSALESQMPEDLVQDLAGRLKLITRDEETDLLHVYWVLTDQRTGLPFVADQVTGLPYLLQFSEVRSDMQLYRLLRAQDHGPVVADTEKRALFRPVLNQYGEVQLKTLSESQAGFSAKEVMDE